MKRDILIGMILEDKILDFIERKSKITDGEPPASARRACAPKKPRPEASEKKKEG